MDQQLSSLAEAVEHGTPCPPIRVVTAGGLYVGTPVPSSVFWDASKGPLAESIARAQKRGLRRVGDHERAAAAVEADDIIGGLRSRARDRETGGLTLQDAVLHRGSETVKLAVARVPLEAVTGWWINLAEVKESSQWFVGMSVPTGN
jgi:hypothetical protein